MENRSYRYDLYSGSSACITAGELHDNTNRNSLLQPIYAFVWRALSRFRETVSLSWIGATIFERNVRNKERGDRWRVAVACTSREVTPDISLPGKCQKETRPCYACRLNTTQPTGNHKSCSCVSTQVFKRFMMPYFSDFHCQHGDSPKFRKSSQRPQVPVISYIEANSAHNSPKMTIEKS